MERDARGSDARDSGCCARAGSVELVNNARAGCQVGPMTTETGYGSCSHGCVIDNGKKDQPKQPGQWQKWWWAMLRKSNVEVGPRNLGGARTIPRT